MKKPIPPCTTRRNNLELKISPWIPERRLTMHAESIAVLNSIPFPLVTREKSYDAGVRKARQRLYGPVGGNRSDAFDLVGKTQESESLLSYLASRKANLLTNSTVFSS